MRTATVTYFHNEFKAFDGIRLFGTEPYQVTAEIDDLADVYDVIKMASSADQCGYEITHVDMDDIRMQRSNLHIQ